MKNTREYVWDNLKFILIILVVIGHEIDYYTKESMTMRKLFLLIYAFHMPLFIFISGYFSKNAIKKEDTCINRMCSYFTIYLILKMSFFIVNRYILKYEQVKLILFTEGDVPWYLFAMTFWSGITYFLKNLKTKYLISFSLIAGVLVGYNNSFNDFLCLSRIIVFYPFFIVGYYTTKENIQNILENRQIKIASILLSIILVIIVIILGDNVYFLRGYFTGRNSYINLKDPVYGSVFRILCYIISCTLSLGIFYMIPKKNLIFTKLGSRTLQIYFLHHIFISLYMNFNLNRYLSEIYTSHWKVLYICLAILLTIVLSIKPLSYPFEKIMKIKFSKFLLRDTTK